MHPSDEVSELCMLNRLSDSEIEGVEQHITICQCYLGRVFTPKQSNVGSRKGDLVQRKSSPRFGIQQAGPRVFGPVTSLYRLSAKTGDSYHVEQQMTIVEDRRLLAELAPQAFERRVADHGC
jgi:hypothetical protein